MGQYIDIVDNLVEGLLEVIPIKYLSSSSFEKEIQESKYRIEWNLFVVLGLSLKESLEGKDAVTEEKIKSMCRSQAKRGAPSIYKFVSFLINAYCSQNNIKIDLREIKIALHSLGVAKFDKINHWDSSDYDIMESVTRRNKLEMPSKLSSTQQFIMKDNRNFFIVHGHNEEVKEKVARFVAHLKLEPIILHEQPDQGRTIIEKFEANSAEVNFAIVLLTADDEGKAKKETDYKKRARQNVIFEMGYFVGLISRSHVMFLLEEGVEKPSDLDGIVYTSLKEDWKTKLFKELQACGYDVDPKDLVS